MTLIIPRDDVRKAAGEILKRVDQMIKAGEIDRSVREIIHAKEIDPTNGYIHAYEERLGYLKEEHEKNISRERTRKEAEDAARKRDAELLRELEKKQQKDKQELELQQRERKKREEQINAEKEHPVVESVRVPFPGLPASIASGSQRVDGFIRPSSKEPMMPDQSKGLSQAGRDTGTLSERHAHGDTQDRSIQRTTRDVETILVVDDDDQMLTLIATMLMHHGYQVTSLITSDEAYALLKHCTPGLILSDIDLKTSTMGGFAFYESIKKLTHLSNVPFLFLSGLADEIIVRTGKELGADDYLTKPVSEENLMAAVKGKLKRFGRLREQP
jgi:CheY-like chemotaxis protein